MIELTVKDLVDITINLQSQVAVFKFITNKLDCEDLDKICKAFTELDSHVKTIIINIDKAIIETFSYLKANLQKSGRNVDDIDLLIGSTSLTNNLKLLTNNEKHFKKILILK